MKVLTRAAFGEDVLDGPSVLGQGRGLRLKSCSFAIFAEGEGPRGGWS